MTFLAKIIRFCLIFILVSFFVFVAYKQFKSPKIGIDDANIFFVYAKNFADGHGLVYNIGGERVEGFTSLLWMLICAAAFFITKNHAENLLLIFNVIAVSVTLTIITLYLDKIFEEDSENTKFLSFYSILYLSIIILTPAYISWTTITLMDVGIWNLLLTANIIAVLKSESNENTSSSSLRISILTGLLLITRPESMLWCLVFIGLAWVQIFSVSGYKKAFEFIRLPLLTYILTLTSLTCFRLYYFGYPLPNTYYAKVSPSLIYNLKEGYGYFHQYFKSGFIIQLAILCVSIFLYFSIVSIFNSLLKTDYQHKINCGEILTFICVIGLIIPVLHGGDHFGSFRFYQPVYPLLILNLFVIWRYINKEIASFKIFNPLSLFHKIVIYIIISVFIYKSETVNYKNMAWGSGIEKEFRISEDGRKNGVFLSEFFAELDRYPSVGVIVAGGFKFSYSGNVIDLMGLNNIEMAHYSGSRVGFKNHAAFEKDVFYTLQPDIANLNISDCSDNIQNIYDKRIPQESWGWKVALKGLADDDKFLQQYDFAQIRRRDLFSDKCVIGFFSKKFLSDIKDKDIYDIQIAQKNNKL